MKKILYTTIFIASFAFAGQAQAALYEQQMEYQQHMMVDGGGGGGGGTTTVYQPTTNTNFDDTLMLNPNTNLIRDDLHLISDQYSDLTQQATVTATVSSCPSGTTMSSDKCCCVNN